MAVISRNGYAIALKVNYGDCPYRLVRAHKTLTKAQESLRKILQGEPDINYVMVHECDGGIYEIYNPFGMKE